MISSIHASPSPPLAEDEVARAGASRRRRAAWLGWVVLLALWLGLVAYGLLTRFLYDTTPGRTGHTPVTLPAASRLPHARDRGTLFLFVHPECPCTRASLQELASLLEGGQDRVLPVLVVAPVLAGERRWEDTPGAAIASRVAGLVRFADDEGQEAARFGAETSGYVALYDASGQLQFAGGITATRGHVGENVGLQTVRQWLLQEPAPLRQHPVYGCPLEAGSDEERTR